jgi:hypothetical protein
VQSAIWKIADHAKSKSLHTDLTGTSDFSAFVKPRLAIGPKGNHNPEAPSADQFQGEMVPQQLETSPEFAGERFYGKREATPNSPFAKAMKLAPKQIVEIEIPVATAANFGVTFMALPSVSASLFDASGAMVGKNLANTPEAGQWFRSIFFDKQVANGTWKLKLENTSDRETEVVLTTWADAVR